MACAVCELHTETTFRVDGMDCHEEVRLLEKRLARVQGVHGLSADVLSQRMRVEHDAARVAASAIAAAVADTGMRAWVDEDSRATHESQGTDARLRAVAIAAVAIAAAALVKVAGGASWLELPLLAVAIVAGGYHIAPRAWRAARQLSLDINFLMTIAVVGAIVIGEWFEAATVVGLFALAQLLEARSMDRARHAIRALMDVAPSEVTLLRKGAQEQVPAASVAPGDLMLVRPGERIALDGEIVSGTSDVNQAPVTGEPVPVARDVGDSLYAGTINGHGALTVRVTRLVRDSTVARIIHLVERAQAQRAPSQAFVDRFARVYTPAVIAAALVVALGPPLLFEGAWSAWGYRALVLLVISCPCALVISTPVSVVSALAAAARHGILFKGGQALERLGAVRAVAFDKTGTLTRAALRVSEVVPAPDYATGQVLALAAAIEAHSEHPIARAVVAAAEAADLTLASVADVVAVPGKGARGRVNGEVVIVGSPAWVEAEGARLGALAPDLARLLGRGETAVVVATRGEVVGLIGLADLVRSGAREAVVALGDHGVAHVAMLTGDAPATAATLGRALGISEVHAGLLPEEKLAAIERLRRDYGAVAMVGDGVNDAPALAAADVGIAMGSGATDVALETADVALITTDLHRVADAVALGRATLSNIKINIGVALGLKALFLALAIAGRATLWMAVVADMGASLLVVTHGLRLLRFFDRQGRQSG